MEDRRGAIVIIATGIPRAPLLAWACLVTAVCAGACSEEPVPPDIVANAGLLGHYYADLTIEEASADEVVPELLRIDGSVDFPVTRASFGTELSPSGSRGSRFTVRWNGYVYAEGTERGIVVTGLGRAGLLIDGKVVFAPRDGGGLIDERHPLKLDEGWHEVELWYQNLDVITHAVRFGWMSANRDLIPITTGYLGVSRGQVPEQPLALTCEPELIQFETAVVRVDADGVGTLTLETAGAELASDSPVSTFTGTLIGLEPDTDVTVTAAGTDLYGNAQTGTCTFHMNPLPAWVAGQWRTEYFDETELTGTAGVRFEPHAVTHPEDLPYVADRTEWFPGAGTNTFSARWSAWLHVDQAGTYEASVASDDGSRLRVDGIEVIDLWNERGTESGTVDLLPGYHLVEVEYYQTFGDSYLSWEMGRLGASDRVTPVAGEVLFAEIGEMEEPIGLVSSVQRELATDDESYELWTQQGCIGALDIRLNAPASLEVDGEVLLISMDVPASVHRLCILPGSSQQARLRFTDLNQMQSAWVDVRFTRPGAQ